MNLKVFCVTFNLFITKHLYQSSISHIVSRDATAFLTSESRSDTYLLLHSTPLIFCRILNLHTTETLHQNRQTDFGYTPHLKMIYYVQKMGGFEIKLK